MWRWLAYPRARLAFALQGVRWGRGWRLYGVPIVQRHRQSVLEIGAGCSLRSATRANPLGANHAVILCTWQAGAVLRIGEGFAMTGGSLCAAESVMIGDGVLVGANCTIIDSDFHPSDAAERRADPKAGKTAAVVIEDGVFIGMNSLVLKGVHLGKGSTVAAGSVVTRDVPAGALAGGNPARVIREA